MRKYHFSELIEEITELNTELHFGLNDIVGVTIEKGLIPTIANLTKTELNKFYIVKPNTFVFNPRTHGVRLGMGYNDTENTYITSWNNVAFKVKDDAKCFLNPQYLWLYFNRSEWDRETNYHAWGSSTIVFSWNTFKNLTIKLPEKEEQDKIVRQYKLIDNRIKIKKQINDNLFEQGKTVLRHMYDQALVFDNVTNLDNFCSSVVSGGTPSRTVDEYWDSNDIPWLKNGEIKNNIILSTEEYISKVGLSGSSAKLVPKYTVNMAMYCVSEIQVSLSCIPLSTNQAVLNLSTDSFRKACFVYYLLATFGNNITSQANGSAQQNLSKEKIISFEFLEPKLSEPAFDFLETNMVERINIAKEIVILSEMQAVLLSQLSR